MTETNAAPETTTPATKKLTLPKGVTKEIYTEVKAIMVSGFEAKQTPDAIKSAIFATGNVPFSILNKLYNFIGEHEGLIVNPKVVHTEIRKLVATVPFTFAETYAALSDIAKEVKTRVAGADKKKVMGILKKLFKDNDKPFPKKPIVTGSKMGITFRTLIDLFAENPQTTEAECIEALKAVVEKEDNAVNYGKMYHKVLYAAANGLTADEVLKDLYGDND